MTATGKIQLWMSVAAVVLGLLYGLLLAQTPSSLGFALLLMFLSGAGAGLLAWVFHDLHKDGVL